MAPRKRIVLFTAGHTEPNGGLARHSRLLAEGFADQGWDVRVISRAGMLRRPRVIRGRGLVALELPGFGRPRLGAAVYMAVAVPLGILWARRAIGCLAVHLGTTTVAAGVSAGAWRLPFTGLSTSSGTMGEVEEAARCRPGGLRRRILRRATYLVAQSAGTAPELRRLTDPARIAVVPNPVLLPKPPSLDGRPRAVFVGRLSEEKDLQTLIEAWRGVAEQCQGAHLDIVGSGGDWRSVEDELRDTVRRDPVLSASVTFCGWTDDVPAALSDHDVFVLPSKFEGMSNSLLEACSYGRVVVASEIAPNTAVLGSDHPLLFPAGDVTALAERLLVAFGDEAIRTDARQRALDAVGPNDVRRVVDMHAALLEGRQPGTTSR